MPIDSLEEGGQPPAETPPSGETPPAEAPSSEAPLTAEQIAALIQEANASNNQPVLEALQKVQGVLEAQQAAAAAEPTKDPNESAEALLTDPDKWAEEKIATELRKHIAPMAAADYEVQRDERIEARAAEIDEMLGEGFFDKEIRDRLTGENGTLAAWPINQQMHPKVIDSAINGIMGNDFRDPETGAKLVEALTKTAKAKQERAVASPPNMMGPGRPRATRSDTLTPDMKYTLKGFQDVGIKVTEEQIKEALRREPTLEAWTQAKEGAQ